MPELQTPSMISVNRGHYFDLLNPRGWDYDIVEIAHALSNLCRYTGHCKSFYSVAEHSVYVSQLVPEKYAMAGLLHDASEAFCGDVSKPLKEMLNEYKLIEDNVAYAIFEHFNLTWPMHPEVHAADAKMYWTERAQIAPQDQRDAIFNQENRASPKIKIKCLLPTAARDLFLNRMVEIVERDNERGQEAVPSNAAAQ